MMNNLKGGIPKNIGQSKKLRFFSFGSNNLSGTIPPSMYNLSSLTTFSVPVNQLGGSLRFDFGLTFPNLEMLDLGYNRFSGLIPATLSNASKISFLLLLNNSFTGKVPTLTRLHNLNWLLLGFNHLGNNEDDDLDFLYSLTNKTELTHLAVNDNHFGGTLPETVGNFSTKLRTMQIGGNQIHGSVPVDIGNLISLETFGLEMNQLTGIIPDSIGKLQNLRFLSLFENKRSGNIPSSLGNVTLLTVIDLSENSLQGNIPSSLGNCMNLLMLLLYRNKLSGPIPKEAVGISSLSRYLDLSENQLTGSLPSEMDKLVNLGVLSLSKNKLSGKIPTSLGSCRSLESLYLGGNSFQGSIPESLNSLRALQDLDLSYNNLTGKIPKFLADFKLLTNLDLSFNDLDGEVPEKGVFASASAFSISGNKKLCGGILRLNLSRCISDESTTPKSSTKLILVVAIPCGSLGLVLTISCLLQHCLRKTKNKHTSGPLWDTAFWRVSYGELLQATDGFSSANLLGTGSFGFVYKGILKSNGTIIAVKVFNLLRKGASQSFMAECATLINIRHRNLVKVLTACSSIDFQGNDFKALVYDFLVNGSLEQWLHPIHTSDETPVPKRLNLISRLNIAIDVASALDYLHNQCETTIIHCDLKPGNVLLDGDMIACVGDFGLARFRSENSSQVSTNQTSSVGLKGTIGYAAPEYGTGSEVSTYGDVYSYGILLLEMFTGKRPTDEIFDDGLNLHNFAKRALPNCVVEISDPILLREAEANGSSYTRNHNRIDEIVECLISIFKVGVACSTETPRERMDICDAATELCRIRGILLGSTRMHGRQGNTIASQGITG